MQEDIQAHWDRVYATKAEDEVSWYQEVPVLSMALIAAAGVGRDGAIIDVGGGRSRLIDGLLNKGFTDLSVLDLSDSALAAARDRLGQRSSAVRWIVADATRWTPDRAYDLWHDRATFHFLTEPSDRAAYLKRLQGALRHGAWAVIATFASDGPQRCSGLPVSRYSPEMLAAELGAGFELIEQHPHLHSTPSGVDQSFQFSLFRRV